MSLVLHPDAFLERRIKHPRHRCTGEYGHAQRGGVGQTGVTIHKVAEASTLADGLVMVTGEVERVTDFREGFPWAGAKIDDKWVTDPFRDDQGIAINLKGKGLVVISGCSHAV